MTRVWFNFHWPTAAQGSIISMENLEHHVGAHQALYDEIDRLAETHRTECLWFLRRDYLPRTTAERLRVLKYIEQHGDRATFVEARVLRNWLLQTTKEISAAS